MPLPPKPWTYVCPNCGWKRTVVPPSDALMGGTFVACCPRCGNHQLEQRAAGSLEVLSATLLQSVRRRL